MTMSHPNTLIYAELLANIRQISVIAALETPCDAATGFQLSADRRQIALQHDGTTTVLKLPGQVSPVAQLSKLSLGSRELSCRLPLAGERKREDPESNESPWPARSLGNDIDFSCRNCEGTTVKQGIIKAWKDLPSENWAEMMDFWHCHKPSEHANHGSNGHTGRGNSDTPSSKGYGANTKFMAQTAVGFVDLTTFLLAEGDCTCIEIKSSDDSDQYQTLTCSTCQQYIGHLDQQANGYRLYKWRLRQAASPQISIQPNIYQPSMSSIITAQLQSIMLAQCSSKLLLLPMNWKKTPSRATTATNTPPTTFLSLWILSPSIRYSTTATGNSKDSASKGHAITSSGKPAMKIFWKTVSSATAESMLAGNKVEEYFLPQESILEIEFVLRDSASFLPPSGRKFQDWDVGLLERFEDNGATRID